MKRFRRTDDASGADGKGVSTITDPVLEEMLEWALDDPNSLVILQPDATIIATIVRHRYFHDACIVAYARGRGTWATARKYMALVERWARLRGAGALIMFTRHPRFRALGRLAGLELLGACFGKELTTGG